MSLHPTTNEINITGVRLRNRNPRISSIDREKRKSEVLIAAQSLDNEIQSVKNLKRLSIGSLDLLIDPELEFRVNTPESNKRKSWIAPTSSVSPDASMESNDTSTDSESFTNSSIDVTRAEYIHDEVTQQALLQQEQSRNSSLSNESINRSTNTTRHLTGINSLRRGLQNVGSRRTLSSHSSLEHTISGEQQAEEEQDSGDDDDDEPITNNLLWVPANQHPNVKPENYIELVQDTLHNIQIQDSSSDTPEQIPQHNDTTQDKENRLDRGKSTKKYNRSLVRRPSSLRKSYSKLTESSDSKHDEDLLPSAASSAKRNSSGSTHSSRNQRTASLKDITEELTKISNNAGLTNSDAITLARTLSMAGSFTGVDDEALLDDGTNNEIDTPILNDNNKKNDNDDTPINSEEFASKMFMKNGLTIPQRSSLRRSKFNTYRIRSADSLTTSSTSPPNNNDKRHSSDIVNRRSIHDGNDTTGQLHMPHSPITFDHESPSTIGSVESPGSISDLYDHYTQLNKGSRAENDDDSHDDDTDEIDTSGPNSQDSSLLSNDSVLYRPTQTAKGSGTGSLLHENTDNLIDTLSSGTVTKLNSNTATVTSDSWSWAGKSEKDHSINNEITNNDLIDNTKISEQTNHNLKNRSNHSKNRHKPIFNISNNSSNNPNFNNTNELNKKSSRPSLTKSIAGSASISNSTDSTNSLAHNEKDDTVHTHVEPIIQVTTQDEPKNEAVVAQKKPSLEEKLVNLFKRRTHRHKSSDSNGQSSSKSNESGVQEELKKKISKFRKHQKKQQPPTTTVKPTIEITPVITERLKSPTPKNEIHEVLQLQRDDSQLSEQSHSSENTELPTLQPAVSVTSTKNREPVSPPIQTEILATENGNTPFTETVHELDGDDSQDVSGNSESLVDTSLRSDGSTLHQDDSQVIDQEDTSTDFNRDTTAAPPQQHTASSFPPRKLTFADVKRPEKPNAPIQFTDSAFGFPLPELTNSTVIMFDHRLGINVERAIYRLSHLKLSDSKRELRQQVLLSNFMYSYLNLVNHTLYMEQSAANTTTDYDNYNSDELEIEMEDNSRQYSTNSDSSDHYGNSNCPEGSNEGLIYGTSNNGTNMEYTTEQNNSNGTILIPEI